MKPFNELMKELEAATSPFEMDKVRLYFRDNTADYPLSQLLFAKEQIEEKAQQFIVPLTKEQKDILTSFGSWLNQ